MSEGPFTDDMVKHYLVSMQTQAGIRKYAEAMAHVLAEAGRASQKVTGDSPNYAVQQWSKVILERALQILKEDAPTPMQKKLKKALEKK